MSIGETCAIMAQEAKKPKKDKCLVCGCDWRSHKQSAVNPWQKTIRCWHCDKICYRE